MTLELYYYNECGFCQSVLNCLSNLHCSDKVLMKNIRENPAYADELIGLTGAKTVPVLIIDGKPMSESEQINQFLVQQFL